MKRSKAGWNGLLAGLGIVAGLTQGCQLPTNSRLNAPPQGATDSEKANKMQEQYVYMTDNAMLEDMNMSSVHFVPHNSELNSLGVRRLKRFAAILQVYGGVLRYDGSERDKDLRTDRMEQMKTFLASSGVAPDRFSVTEDIAGGEGISGTEAVMIRSGSRYAPKEGAQTLEIDR
jgi:hypothetical protein